MAAYAPQDAITYAKAFIKSMPIDTADSSNLKYKIVDYAASLLWTAAPWSWTLGSIADVTVLASTSDYTITVPADFLYLNKAVITDGQKENELVPVSFLGTPTQIGVPSRIATIVASNKYRLYPLPPASFTGRTLVTQYKKTPPKLISSNYATAGAQILPDCYFPVLEAGVLWMAYQYADDNRAGTVTVDENGKCQWTQQAGVFQGMIAEMRKAEKLILDYPGQPQLRG